MSEVQINPTNSRNLKVLREQKNLSVSDVSQRTRLSPKQVDALESGRFAELPGSAFVLGAIRSYCKVLGVEPEIYLNDAKDLFSESQRTEELSATDRVAPVMPSRNVGGLENSGSRLWWVASGLLAAAAIGIYFANPAGIANLFKKTATVPSPTILAPTASTGSAVLAPETKTETVKPVADSAPVISAPATSEASIAPSASVAAPVTSETVAAAATATVPSKKIELVLARDAWVEIREGNGKVLANRLFKAGSSDAIEAVGPVAVIVGSASGVSLNWGGVLVDLKPFTKDDVARVTLK